MDKIKQYLVEKKKVSEIVADILIAKIAKHDDILKELEKWFASESYDFENPLSVEGYTAKSISELNPKFDVIGVYDFMVTLRETPQKAQEYIKDGFCTL